MNKAILLLFVYMIFTSGCAYKIYKGKEFVQTIDTQTKEISSRSKPKIYMRVDENSLKVKTVMVEIQKLKSRSKIEYKNCWSVADPHPLFYPFILVSMISDSFLGTSFDGLSPSPGCRDLIEWTEWEEQPESQLPDTPHSTEVTLDCGFAGEREVVTDDSGKARLDMKPLLNHLKKDYFWIIKAKAHIQGDLVSEELVINTSELGVTWDKPRIQPSVPPQLKAFVERQDENKNNFLDANEVVTLKVKLINEGKGDAFLIDVIAELFGQTEGVTLLPERERHIEILPGGKKSLLRFRLKAENDVPAQKVGVRIKFREWNGFEPETLTRYLITQAR